MNSEELKQAAKNIEEIIRTNSEFLLTCHENPDGDAIGATNAIAKYLEHHEKNVHVIYPDDIPDKYKFMKFPTSWEYYSDQFSQEYNGRKKTNYDVVITLDSSDLDRVDKVVAGLTYSRMINIDHHPTNTLFADINLVSPQTSSTCELLYHLFIELSSDLDYDIAVNLYTGIFTDTGSFRFENVSRLTFGAAEQLLSYGVKPHEIAREIYEKMPVNIFNFTKEIINDLRMTTDQRIAWLICPRQLMEKYDVDDGEIEGVITYARMLNPVEFAVVFKETKEGHTKISFRSKTLDVSSVAFDFGGGGHARAAGCFLEQDIHKSVDLVINRLKKEVLKLNSQHEER